jgi:hypothetical protein
MECNGISPPVQISMLVGLDLRNILSTHTDPCIVAQLGNPGWDWEGLQPYYKKVCSSSRLGMIFS